jgi:hypothetical protein
MRTIECWRWRFRDPSTGQVCRTPYVLSAEEAAARYVHAERIPGTLTLREVDEPDFVDTLPEVGYFHAP